MLNSWLRLAVYLDGKKRFDAVPIGPMSTIEAYWRMDFVFDSIEMCFCDQRHMDMEIFYSLDDVSHLARTDISPPVETIEAAAELMRLRYGLQTESTQGKQWIRQLKSGEIVIWIDQTRIVNKRNRWLFWNRD